MAKDKGDPLDDLPDDTDPKVPATRKVRKAKGTKVKEKAVTKDVGGTKRKSSRYVNLANGQTLFTRVGGKIVTLTVEQKGGEESFVMKGTRYRSPSAAGKALNKSVGKQGYAVFSEEEPSPRKVSKNGAKATRSAKSRGRKAKSEAKA